MLQSATLFVDDIYWHGSGKVIELLTSDKLFVNQRLATLLGLPFDRRAARPTASSAYRAPIAAPRRHADPAGCIWAVSDVATTSIVHRGKEDPRLRHLRQRRIPFPPGLLNSPDIIAALAARPTEIEKADYRLREPGLPGCHGNMDPYGRVLEGSIRSATPHDCRRHRRSTQIADFSRRGAAVRHASPVRSRSQRRSWTTTSSPMRGADDVQLRDRPHDPQRTRPASCRACASSSRHRRHNHRAVPSSLDRATSRDPAQEVPRDVVQDFAPAFLRGAGASALLLPLLATSRRARRGSRRRCGSWSSTTRWARSTWARPRPTELWRPTRDCGDHDQLRAAAEQRAVHAAAAEDGR